MAEPAESFSHHLSDRISVVVTPALDQVRNDESDSQRCFLYADRHQKVKARSLSCYWAVRELGYTVADMAPRLNITQLSISVFNQLEESIASENGFS